MLFLPGIKQGNPMHKTKIALLLLSLSFSALSAEIKMEPSKWIPPQVKEGMIKDLYSKFEQSSLEFENEQARLVGAAQLVNRFDRFATESGVEKIAAAAPALEFTDFPSSEDALLDAMGRLQMCNVMLALQIPPYGTPSNQEIELTSITGTTVISMSIFFLQTGRDAPRSTIEPYLTSDAMGVKMDQLQTDEEQKKLYVRDCNVTLTKLMDTLF